MRLLRDARQQLSPQEPASRGAWTVRLAGGWRGGSPVEVSIDRLACYPSSLYGIASNP